MCFGFQEHMNRMTYNVNNNDISSQNRFQFEVADIFHHKDIVFRRLRPSYKKIYYTSPFNFNALFSQGLTYILI